MDHADFPDALGLECNQIVFHRYELKKKGWICICRFRVCRDMIGGVPSCRPSGGSDNWLYPEDHVFSVIDLAYGEGHPP